MKKILLFALAMIIAGCNSGKDEYVISEPEEVCVFAGEGLTEWQILQLAIAYTESKFDPSAIGKADDIGIMQIRPIYAREASRLCPDKVYSHKDALDPSKAMEMFNIVQEHHNPTHSIEKAISLHNKADWYKRRVLDNMEFIRRMEKARDIILAYK